MLKIGWKRKRVGEKEKDGLRTKEREKEDREERGKKRIDEDERVQRVSQLN